jgi:signal peptidase I
MSLKTAPTPDPGGPTPPAPAAATPLETVFKGNRVLAAGALLILLQAVPIAGLIVSFREGNSVWTVFAAVLIAGGLLPPVGVFLGQRWGYILGQYVAWGSFIGIVLRVLHGGFTPVYLGPAVLIGVLLVALSPPRTPGDARRPEKKPESFGVWVKENIEAIIIAFIMALVIRCFCIEVFKIPSSSMEPTLLGDVSDNHSRAGCTFGDYHVPPAPPPPLIDQASGDRIMVTKYFYSFSPVERYDVLVFKFPLNQAKNFIKRVVGLPDEQIMIHRGNLFVKKPNEPAFQIARRTLRTQDSIWIDPAKRTDGYLHRKEDFQSAWEPSKPADRKAPADHVIQDNELATYEKVHDERSIAFSYHSPSNPGEHYIQDGAGTPVDDVRIVFDFEITSPKGQVFAEVVNSYGRFEAVLDTNGSSWLYHYKPGSESGKPTAQVDIKNVQLTQDKKFKFDLSIFDGVATVRINDGERAKHVFITTIDKDKDTDRYTLPVTERPDWRIAFGTRDVTFRVKNLAVGRDIYYKGKNDRTRGLREDEPYTINPGHYLMMGDNVANSHDSRAWVKRTFLLKDGRQIVCESQQVNEPYSRFNRQLQEKLGLPEPPAYAIDGDEHGNEIAITREMLDHELQEEEFRQVPEKFIVGKALWIWWPQGRWFHLIR